MADYQLVEGGGLPTGGSDPSDSDSDAPSSGPETPDQEAQTSSKQKQASDSQAQQGQAAFDTMRSRRAFVAGLLANPTSALQQGALSSNLQ